jgi:dynein intermediate chain 2
VSLSFNTKQSQELLGGLYSGQICLWDLREKFPLVSMDLLSKNLCAEYEAKPLITQVKESHYDPAYSARFVHSKAGSEYYSASTDGRLITWEKNINEKEKHMFLSKKTDFKLLE